MKSCGTIFHNTHVYPQRWFLLISLMISAKKGLSAMQAARDLEMHRPTVWPMMHRIRGVLADDRKLLAEKVEMDEASGGKSKKKNRREVGDNAPRGRGTRKIHGNGVVKRGGRIKMAAVSTLELPVEALHTLAQGMIAPFNGLARYTFRWARSQEPLEGKHCSEIY